MDMDDDGARSSMGAKDWSTQTELGRMFAITPRQVGIHLAEAGLKAGQVATAKAVADGVARPTRTRDGEIFFLWRTDRVVQLLLHQGRQLVPLGRPANERRRPSTVSYNSYDKIIATDGSALGNPGPTGWAWVDQTTGETGSGAMVHGTNNVGELMAMYEALVHAGPRVDLLIRADSMYAINVANKFGLAWRRRGWLKGDGKPPENLQLVKAIVGEVDSRVGRTDFEWVKGHAGDEHNEIADSLAVSAARSAA